MTIRPGPVNGRVTAPPSKSITHRAYILAALTGNGLIRNPLRSDDTEATLECLRRLGFLTSDEEGAVRVGGLLKAAKRPLEARESGTTLRLLPPVAALLDHPTRFEASPTLAARPLGGLLEALRALGARTEGAGPPFTVTGPLRGGDCRISGSETSQVVSGILLVAPLLPTETRIELMAPLRSPGYVALTIGLLRQRGVHVEETTSAFTVAPGQRFRQKAVDVPGDYSSAAFLLAAAAVSGGEVTVDGLDPVDAQPDRAIEAHLAAFGARVRRAGSAVTVQGAPLVARDVDVAATPDLFPVLCAVAAVAPGVSRIGGAPQLRAKESDRVQAMAATLRSFGVACKELTDGLIVTGGRPRATDIQGHGDHRIALAASVLALAADAPSHLEETGLANKSYPRFFDDLSTLEAQVAR